MSDQIRNELPERPNLEHLKKQAKRLLQDYRGRDPAAVFVVKQQERNPDPEKFSLHDSQRVLARTYGFPSWTALKENVALKAITNGDAKNLQAVIDQSSDPQKLFSAGISTPKPTGHCFGKDATLLQFATFRNRKGDVAKTLIENGAEIDLHSACGLGMTEVIGELVSKDPSAIDQQVDTYYPLQYAIAAGKVESVRCLLENGDDVHRTIAKVGWFDWEDDALADRAPDWLPIHMSAIWGFDDNRVEVARCLAEFGADLNASSPLDGSRPIHLAAMYCSREMIRFLVSNGIDVDSRTADSENLISTPGASLPDPAGGHEWTALMVTLGEGFVESAKLLMELGADANAVNSFGRTPLHMAAGGFWQEREAVYAELVQLLFDAGADKTVEDRDGKLPVHIAEERNYTSVVKLLT